MRATRRDSAVSATKATLRRIEVLELRVRIETLARRCVAKASKEADVRERGSVHGRLLFALVSAPSASTTERHKQVRLVQFVYRRACDVLHGRVDALQVPDAMLQEWRLAIERLEEAVGV